MSGKIDWLQRVCKWRSVFTGWQLGTRAKGDPEGDAVRDHRELTIVLRAEVTALSALLMKKGVFTIDEYVAELQNEARELSLSYERRFPGFKAADHGMDINVEIARDTMAGWKP
jgi:hypothetical protein